jgi:DNA-directed RNA polymerase subunit RPC12/RpoP
MRLGHRCPNCGSFRTKRSGPRNGLDRLYELVLIRMYRCMQCNWPFHHFAGNLRPIPSSPSQPQNADD